MLAHHLSQWLNSHVDKHLALINCKSIDGLTVYDYLFTSPDIPRRNDGRVISSMLERYQTLEAGGWWCNGIDLSKPDTELAWGQLKPDVPRHNREGKIIKYEGPPLSKTEAIALKLTWELAFKIVRASSDRLLLQKLESESLRHNPPLTDACPYSAQIYLSPKIPIVITEGAKKAGALITRGKLAICVPGVWNTNTKEGNSRQLIPQIEAIALKGRETIFCFDNDSKPRTRSAVHKATIRTAKLLQYKGCKVSVIQWNGNSKGIDDLINDEGVERFESIYQNRLSLYRYSKKVATAIDSPFITRIEQQYLSSTNLPDCSCLLIKSPKGSGKTQAIANLPKKRATLIIGHRRRLNKELAKRFGVGDENTFCVDSIYRRNRNFRIYDWAGATIVIDELEQVLWHLLNSATCRRNRAAIIDTLAELLQYAIATGGRVIGADADLSGIGVNFIQELCGEFAQIVENTYQTTEPIPLYNYCGNSPTSLISSLEKAVERREKAILFTNSVKPKYKWSTINLEAYFKRRFPILKILRLDSQTKDLLTEDLNQLVVDYDLVIASSVVETGVSIDTPHFDSVWAIANGLQSIDSVKQTLARVRKPVPRHLWAINNNTRNAIGGGSDSWRLLRYNVDRIAGCLGNFDEEDNIINAAQVAWAKYAAVINMSLYSYRFNLVNSLESEGYKVNKKDEYYNPKLPQQLQEITHNNYSNYCQEIINAPPVNKVRIEGVKMNERDKLSKIKADLVEKYGIEVTQDLIEKDDKGWYKKILTHYYLLQWRSRLPLRDNHRIRALTFDNKVFNPDVAALALLPKIRILEVCNIKQFFEPDKDFTIDTLKDWYQFMLDNRHDIMPILGIKYKNEFNARHNPVRLAQEILRNVLGLSLTFEQQIRVKTETGEKVRIRFYSAPDTNPDGRKAVFEYWDSKAAKEVEQHSAA